MSNGNSDNAVKAEWKTTANYITIARILLIPVFVVIMLAPWPQWFYGPNVQDAQYFEYAIKPWVAAVVYAILALTDGIDGYVARSRNQVTSFGKFLDPIADKLLVVAALLALIELGDLPSWPVLIIIAREFLVQGIRMIAATKGVVIAARKSGKVKTALTLVAILMFIIKRSSTVMALGAQTYTVIYVLSWIVMSAALLMTIISMLQYFMQAASIFNGTADAAAAGNIAVAAEPAKANAASAGSSAVVTAESGDAVCEAEIALQQTKTAERLLEAAREKGIHLATAESCTGGLIGARITAIPGSSDAFEGGVISYSYDVKEAELGVSHESLSQYGAVSEQVALQMAEGARRSVLGGYDDSHAVAVAVTGVAGPGFSEGKPAGTVWFGIAGRGPAEAHVCHFSGSRQEVREQTVLEALKMLESRTESPAE